MFSKKVFKIKPDYVWKAQEMVWFVFSQKESAKEFSEFLAKEHELKGSDKKSPRMAWPNASKFAVKVTPKEYEILRNSGDKTLPELNDLLPAYNSGYITEQINKQLTAGQAKVKDVDVDFVKFQKAKLSSSNVSTSESDVTVPLSDVVYKATIRMASDLDDANTAELKALIESSGSSMSVKRGKDNIVITANTQDAFETIMNNLCRKVEGPVPEKK